MRTGMLPALVGIIILICGGFLTGISADELMSQGSQLTVPWDEFKKLVNLDEDEIVLSLETYQKLVAQTGVKTTPPHTVRQGNVVLTRAEFKKLIDGMRLPADPQTQPPFDYLITKAIYSGKMAEDNTAFVGIFTVHVLKQGAYLRIPLLPQSIALEDIRMDGKEALVISENGYHHVILSRAGEYEVTASFSLKTSLDKGPHKIDLAIQQTPITLLKLELPLKDIDVEIPQAQQVASSTRGNTTTVSAVITPGRTVSIRWRKKVAITEKIPPKLYSEVYHLISIDDDALKINSDINYTILHSEVDAVQLAIPDNTNVLTVTGEGVGEWQETEQEGQRLILIPFTYGKKGSVTVRVTSEIPLSATGLANVFSGIRALETVRETGFIGIELNTSAEVLVTESVGLEPIATPKLPAQLINKSAKPLIMGFKYLKHPFSLVLDIKKHEKIAVPVATINSANIVTLFTEDGKVVHRLVYQVRNSAKQFLEIQVPEKADVWSVFVGNEPVESSLNSHGKLLVPLIRSRSVNNRLDTFPVEVIYCLVEDRFTWSGSRASALPAVDLLISQLMWSVYLPNDYSYIYFRSTLEKEEIIRGLNVFKGAQRQYNERAMKELSDLDAVESDEMYWDKLRGAYKGKEYKSRFRNVPLQEEQLSSQVQTELEFSGRLEGLAQQEPQAAVSGGVGILPIQIQIPTGGQVYRFAKTIVKTEDPLTMSVVYAQNWILGTIKWVVIVLIVLILIIMRKTVIRIFRWFKDGFSNVEKWYKKHDSTFEKISKSKMTPFVLFGLFIVFWSISKLLTLLVFFLFWMSVVYHIILYRERRAERRSKIEEQDQDQSTTL
ncbi:MAG: hypothetical protein JSV84_12055 [Gemmatimonadota bacterium]|nr:MAG: hypothetical protein JSV84_12055 [Gemmatimonadota bacterium]